MPQKSYTDFMAEISADDLYKGLLAHGLFAEKILYDRPFASAI